jgi:hypothetical protein
MKSLDSYLKYLQEISLGRNVLRNEEVIKYLEDQLLELRRSGNKVWQVSHPYNMDPKMIKQKKFKELKWKDITKKRERELIQQILKVKKDIRNGKEVSVVIWVD